MTSDSVAGDSVMRQHIQIKPSLTIATVGVLGLAIGLGAWQERPGGEMATAADRFLKSLDDGQKKTATFAFDDAERLNWHFIPRERKGLSIKAMKPEQRALAFGLVESGLSAQGAIKATTIMSLEAILLELEKGSGPVRDPELYFVTVFGQPGQGDWGWRLEGHHLSLNFTLKGEDVVAATPTFFGSNPAEVLQGPRQGLRTLADLDDRALRLIQALDETQQKVAIVEPKAPSDIRAANTPQPPTDAAVGIPYGQLTEDQRAMARALVEAYAANMPADVSREWLTEIRDTGPEKVAFAWFGPADRSQPHAYRVQGPTFLIEFNNTQNNANHVHAVWRNMLGDFGRPMAAQ